MKQTTLILALVATAAQAAPLNNDFMPSEGRQLRGGNTGYGGRVDRTEEEDNNDDDGDQQTGGYRFNEQDFLDWANRDGRSYTNRREFNRRQAIYKEHDQLIQEKNAESEASGRVGAVKLAHNHLSDWTDAEIMELAGAKLPTQMNLRGSTDPNTDHHNNHDEEREGRRKLCDHTTEDIDWVAAGKVHRTKYQGSCGSCYSFTANTVLESMIAIAEDSDPIHLSEQQIVDCGQYYDNNYQYYQFGCSGGWPGESWNYARDKGLKYDSNYSYVGYEQDCKYDNQPDVMFDIVEYDMLSGYGYSSTVDEIVEKLEGGPMSIAFQSACSAFWYYDSGIITSADCEFQNLDHVIVLTGYNSPRDADYENISTKSRWNYRWRDANDPAGGCANAGETYLWYGYDVCWWYDLEEIPETFPANQGVWSAQNSWGEWWGKSGMVHIAAEEGPGFQGMNNWVEYMRIDNIRHY